MTRSRRSISAMSRTRAARRANRRTLAALATAAVLALAAQRAQAEVSAVDDGGNAITLAAPAQRIVALAPHLAEQLFAIGAGDRIVATTEHADYPPAAERIPRVARAHGVDVERVAAARPDLIVVWGSGYPPAVIESLRRLRVPVYVNEPGSLDRIASSLERLGRLTGSAAAPAVAADFRQHIDALRGRYAGRAPVSVFYQIWQQPLMTLSGRHVMSEAIRVCGGRNVFEDLAPIAPQVSIEAVLAADPQVIATAEPGGRATSALDPWRRFGSLRAVKAGRLVTLDADKLNRHAPRMADEIAVLCERIDAARN
jgi:iron complex transport system substrate-binding protein